MKIKVIFEQLLDYKISQRYYFSNNIMKSYIRPMYK